MKSQWIFFLLIIRQSISYRPNIHSFAFPEDGIRYSPLPLKEDPACGLTNPLPNEPRTHVPWSAGIFLREFEGWKYLFSGTVIGPHTILTLSRRFWENVDGAWKLKIPRNLYIGVGLKSTNLDERDEFSQLVEVSFARPHTKFNEKTRIHDVALIQLKSPLNFSSFVRPACLPKFPPGGDPNGDLFSPGTIALHGGFDYHQRSNRDGHRDLKIVQIRMQTYEHCLRAFRHLESDTPFYLYCARISSRSTPTGAATNLCLFYGSTPVFKSGPENRYHILGVNSVFTLTGKDYTCDKDSVNWFSRLNGSLTWIKDGMRCGPSKWSCNPKSSSNWSSTSCVPLDHVCQVGHDCEDPIYCEGLSPPCSSTEFECGTHGPCVPKSDLCNGHDDCPDGEDESPKNCQTSGQVDLRTCSPLALSEGLQIECEHDDDPHTRYDCSDRRPAPFGIKAKLSCQKYYKSSINRPSVVRKCSMSNQWVPTLTFGCYPECGKAEKALNLLIVNGSLTSRDLWPWHAALYRFDEDEQTFTYICGGSLIHSQVILTAAHCLIGDEGTVLPPSKFKVILAPISSDFIENLMDSQAQVFDVTNYKYPDGFNTRNYQHDIAVLQLHKAVVFNDLIRPVCYSTSSPEHDAIEKYQLSNLSLGQVIGFGIDESLGPSNTLKFANLPVVSPQDCFDELKEAPKEFTYCAGFTNGTSVCNGDSGGGMVFSHGTGVSPVYYVQGIISYGPKKINSLVCNSHTYAVFTRVAFYADWLQEQIHSIETMTF